MRLTFKYPAYPTQTQETTLLAWLDHLCELQNSARHDRKVAWETEGERVSCAELWYCCRKSRPLWRVLFLPDSRS